MSSTSLRQISGDALYALAVVLSLPPDSLETTGRHKARPSSSWCAEQGARIPGLPRCLLIPHIPHLSVKVSQVAKRVIIAASGGADTVAAKAASKGIRLDAVLHPCATPTALCQAHRGLHPALVREMFFYLTREVADHADWIRRHPQHDFEDEDSDVCHSRHVHDWGLRMIGISALWCTKHTFRALEKGRQTTVKGIRLPGSSSSSSYSKTALGSSAASMSTSTSSTKAYTHIRSSMRMPHLEYPCEACILAAVGARSQTLIDLRASMLSRMAEEQHDKQRRDKKKGISAKKSAKSYRPRDPNLLALIDTYINVMGKEFGEETAMEIRSRSEDLAEMLLSVRVCDSRRRRHRARDVKKLKALGQPTKHVRERLPPRLVTKHGHRLPLPLLPLDCDLWEHYNESVVGEHAPSPGSVYGGVDPRASQQSGEEEEDEQYYVVQDGEEEDDDHEEEYEEEEEEDQTPEVPIHHPQPKLPSVMTSDFMAHLGYDEYFAQAKPTPEWEEDYRRNVLESQTVFESEVSARPREDDEASYVTISVYTEMPASQASTRMTSGRRAAANAAARLSPIPGTLTSSKRAVSAVSSVSSRSQSQSQRSVSSVSARSTSTRGLSQLPDRPSAPTPTAKPRSYPHPPSSSTYSQKTITAAPTKTTTKTTKTKPAFSTIHSETSASSSRVSASASPSPSLRLSRPTASSSSSSVSSLAISRRPVGSTYSSSSSTRSRTSTTATPTPSTPASRMAAARAAAPRTPRTGGGAAIPASTVFVPLKSGRTPTSAESYVAMQATLDANRSRTTLAPALAPAPARAPASTPSTSTRTASTSSKTSTKSSRTTAPATAPSTSSSTVTGLSRFSQPPVSDYKPSSRAQKSAVPKPLFSDPSKRAPGLSSSSRAPSSRAPSSRALTTSSSSTTTPFPETTVTAQFKTPTETITVYTPFIWSQPPPSDVNTANGPRRRLDAVYPTAGTNDDGDVFDDNASACSIVPDDSISVVATKLYEEERDNEARRQYQLQAEYERRRMQRQVINENQSTPTPKGRSGRGLQQQQQPAMSGRNLNHYNPSSSRRPPQAQAPVRAPLHAPLPLSQRQPHPQAHMAPPRPPIRQPMRPRMEAQNQNKPLPHTPVDIKGKKPVSQRLPPTSRSHAQAQWMDQTMNQMMDRPVSNTTQCTEWPKVM